MRGRRDRPSARSRRDPRAPSRSMAAARGRRARGPASIDRGGPFSPGRPWRRRRRCAWRERRPARPLMRRFMLGRWCMRIALWLGLAALIHGCGKKKVDPPAPAPQPSAQAATGGEGAEIDESEEGATNDCAKCTTKGTSCVAGICRLNGSAYWRVTLARVDRSTAFEEEDHYRVCIKPSDVETWTCSREFNGHGQKSR